MMTDQPSHNAPDSGRSIGPLLAVAALAIAVVGVGWFVFRMAVGGPASTNGAAMARDAAKAVEAGLDAAAVYSRQGKFGEASAILSRLAEQSPENQTVRLALAQSLVGEKKFAAAYAQYEAAFAIEAAGGGQSTMNAAHARLQFEAGTCANQAGLTRQAAEHYHLAQLADPADARYPLYLAMIQIKLGEDDAATASLVRAAHLNPELAEAWGTLAELALKKNALGLASQHLENAERMQPEVARWRHVRARIFNRQGEPERAATLLLALPPAARRERDIMTTLAQTYGLLKRPADAARLYADAAKDTPDDAELRFQAATWFERAGDAASAAEHARIGALLGHEGCREMLANAGG
ncbi:MAG: tetratricopeptide repeat protein [Phycisphaeraceae bacterium]|nr:tetratricopeptide repeat protein [Phycisphaeraceae bacterium]MBX3407984.1 tetratricopeptide repeat protein [Phycisphaeraceae bacterium]